jgi:hypothetical protein
VNENDEETRKFLQGYDFKGHEWEIIYENLKKPNLGYFFNLIYDNTKTKEQAGTVVSMVGDDMEFRTDGWDRKILDLINHYNGIGVFFCNDDYIARERCCVNLFVTRAFIKLTMRPFMADFEAEMIDVVWTEVGKKTKTLHFLADVIIKHNHSTAKPKEQWDKTYNRLRLEQEKIHHDGGKAKAKKIGSVIADRLSGLGIIGDSIC